jgi:predicted signal transduction protein with EAL and GGDEF domain
MGHETGDQVLLSVSQRLAETAAPSGFAARLGGDEFTILCPGASAVEEIDRMGEAILQAFQRPLVVGEREMTLSASVGSSVFPDHGDDAETLLRAADAALFRAKALGRSRLHKFSPDLVEAAHTKFVVEQGLRRALDQGEFELVYQPEVELATLEPTLVEALLRWRTPDGRLLTPDSFLGVAEESGLIAELSDWVLRTTIAAAASWFHGAWPEVRIAINVSPRQLFDARFVSRVEELLQQYQLPPRCIEMELTENVLQTGVTTIEALRRLRACGITIALDDFGTGYSSFASLEVLPLARVKLDRSLVASVDTKSPSRAIATSIIGLCRSLDFEVTAEGVERPEQLALLIEHGATHVQGYLLSRPVSGDGLLAELAALRRRLESLMLTLPSSRAIHEPARRLSAPRLAWGRP